MANSSSLEKTEKGQIEGAVARITRIISRHGVTVLLRGTRVQPIEKLCARLFLEGKILRLQKYEKKI